MLLRISMRDEDIRLINYLRCRLEQALRESGENGDREESEMARAVELLNRIFYGCINQKMLEENPKVTQRDDSINGRRQENAGELFFKILFDEIVPGISKAFSSLQFDWMRLNDMDECLDEYTGEIRRAVLGAIEKERKAFPLFREGL